jgi:hypothetical protein
MKSEETERKKGGTRRQLRPDGFRYFNDTEAKVVKKWR